MDFAIIFITLVCQVLTMAIFIRVLLSWLPVSMTGPVLGPLTAILYQITEPILGPLRRIVPPLGMIDITPVVAILLLQFIMYLFVGL